MFRARIAGCIGVFLGLAWSGLSAEVVTKKQLETAYGPIQGQMVVDSYTVLIFKTAQVRFHRETGAMSFIPTVATASVAISGKEPLPSAWIEQKRKIARLPAHEQVRYWKLHQIRHPDRDVTTQLEAALDKMEAIRRQSLVKQEAEAPVSPSYRYRRSSGVFAPYFSGYGYTSDYRYRRAIRKDTQIGLDRIPRKPRPVETWNTAMSLADRARADALSKVSGARAAILGTDR